MLLMILGAFVGCTKTPYKSGTIDDPLKIMEIKREQYRQRDLEAQRQAQAKLERERKAKEAKKRAEEETKAKELARIKKEEEERIKNMTPNERLKMTVDKASIDIEKIDTIAKNARKEEIDNQKSIDEIDKLLDEPQKKLYSTPTRGEKMVKEMTRIKTRMQEIQKRVDSNVENVAKLKVLKEKFENLQELNKNSMGEK